MRKLGIGNIKSFILFSIVVIFVVIIFIFGIKKVLSYDKSVYPVKANHYVFNEDYDIIPIKEDSTVFQNWDGKYYLKSKDSKHVLGPQSLLYSSDDYRMYAYGIIYQLYEDGTVTKRSGQTEIVRNTTSSFYKLDDRKYLMIDKEILDENKDLYAKKFLLIILDKQGNALLLNDEMNIKTLNSLILKSTNFIFDVANEKITYNGQIIDLKKIIGSTNEYVDKIKDTSDNNSNSNGGVNIGDNGTNNSSSDYKGIPQFQKTVSLKDVIPSTTYIDINYSVVDPANTYESVYVLLDDGVNTNKIQLNKDESSYRLRNLLPNYEYTLRIGYSYLDEDNDDSLVEEIQDIIKIRTKKPDYKITITKVTFDRVYFTLKGDSLYKLQSGIITLYSDSTKIKSVNINPQLAVSSNGWQSYIDISESGYEIVLNLEETVYNGNPIEVNVRAKYINY